MSNHLEISVGLPAWFRKSISIEGAADGSAGFRGHLLHGAGIGNAVEEQRMYSLLSDLLGKSRQFGRGRFAVVCPTVD
jgi:hypothetical protein